MEATISFISGSDPERRQLLASVRRYPNMSLYAQVASGPGKEGDRQPVSVQLPNANAGIASALRASYAALPINEQFDRLLARIK